MSLADELLKDLDDLEDDDEADIIKEEDEEVEDDVRDIAELQHMMKENSVRSIAKLIDSVDLKHVLDGIEKFEQMPERQILGLVEEDEEYQLVVDSNNLNNEIDNEIGIIHKYVRDHYAKRFPELESLIASPLDYLRTVKALRNEMDVTNMNLSEILPPATIMIVSVTASTSRGSSLTDEELERVVEACDIAHALTEARMRIFNYVESRMFYLAPNLTNICGATTAARLLGAAGGLVALSKMPACNILVLGASKRALAGFSALAALPHTGFVYYCDLVQRQPVDVRKKVARLIAAKCALAARIDSYKDASTPNHATIGIEIRKDIESKIEKALEPPPSKLVKALPKPDDPIKKRRGGKRVRRLKEKYATSEASKQANRMDFGKLEEDIYQEEMGFTLGRLGSLSGHVRAIETKTKGSISKRLQKELKKQTGGLTSTIRGSQSVVGGTASVAFTPLQGLEIVNPKLNAQRVQEANEKYFGKNATFSNLKK